MVGLCLLSNNISVTRSSLPYISLWQKSDIHQTTYISDALWNRDERFTFGGQKVKSQGHCGVKCAGNASTFRPC